MPALALVAVLLGAWEAVVRAGLVDPLILPAPTSVAQSLVDDRSIREGKLERNHLTLLAESDEGYRNLVRLSSAGFLEGLLLGGISALYDARFAGLPLQAVGLTFGVFVTAMTASRALCRMAKIAMSMSAAASMACRLSW